MQQVTTTDQNALAVLAQQGDQAAKTALINLNIKFIASIARQYVNQGMELDDLMQEGCIGILKAIEKYDPSMGTKFLTYASWWIKQSMLQSLAENNRQVRLPANRVGLLELYKKTKHHLSQSLMRDPSKEEVLEEMEVDKFAVVEQSSFSYDTPIKDGDGGHSSILDLLANSNIATPDSGLLQESVKQEIALVLSKLEERERTVLEMLFGINRERAFTLEEVGNSLGLTRERVRQIKEKALKNLRRLNRRKKLEGLKD